MADLQDNKIKTPAALQKQPAFSPGLPNLAQLANRSDTPPPGTPATAPTSPTGFRAPSTPDPAETWKKKWDEITEQPFEVPSTSAANPSRPSNPAAPAPDPVYAQIQKIAGKLGPISRRGGHRAVSDKPKDAFGATPNLHHVHPGRLEGVAELRAVLKVNVAKRFPS
jgi:hypothetical protein